MKLFIGSTLDEIMRLCYGGEVLSIGDYIGRYALEHYGPSSLLGHVEYHGWSAFFRCIWEGGVPFHTDKSECYGFADRGWFSMWALWSYAYIGILVVVCGMVCCVGSMAWGWWKRQRVIGNSCLSAWVGFLISRVSQPRIAAATTRSIFINTPIVKNFKAANHTHPESACKRNEASNFMELFAGLIGKQPYFLQRSASDQRHHRDGCRTYHWSKDISADYADYSPAISDLLCIVDVDMYMDMNLLLIETFQPVILSTFVPTTVACDTGEYSFTFDENNNVVYKVSGGATYTHLLWNYGADMVTVKSKCWWGYKYHIYTVDRKNSDPHHQIILLTPVKRILSPIIDIMWWLSNETLSRLKVVVQVGGSYFTRLDVMTQNGLMRATGRPNEYLSAKITAHDDDGLASLARASKNTELSPATVRTIVKDIGQSESAVLTEYHRHKVGKICPTVYSVPVSVYNYQYDPAHYAPEKPSLTPFMSPFILGCYAPDKCLNNDKAAIVGRVEKVKPSADIVLDQKMLRYVDEFARQLIPQPHVGAPLDIEDVYAKQNRPSQRMILHRAAMIADTVVEEAIQSFQKAEAYGKINDPRIISTIPGKNKMNYSRYLYAFNHVLRHQKWYAFGKAPIEIANTVVAICSKASSVVKTDLSRFDGRVSKVLRTLEKIVMVRYFQEYYNAELIEIMATQQNQRAITTYGYKYDTGTTRLSGSPETADFNSMDNAFMAYMAKRNMGQEVEEAWNGLGIYGGDDGLTADVHTDIYVAACTSVGQVLEICEVKQGNSGVEFLARLYGPGVWYGDNNSMCDVPRQLSKFHTTHSLPPNVTPIEKLAAKSFSYYLSDRNTPIIGELAKLVVEHYPELVPKKLLGIEYYHANVEEMSQYPNDPGSTGWMVDLVQRQLPSFDHDLFQDWISSAINTHDTTLLLLPPLCVPDDITHVTKELVVVNGEVVQPTPVVTRQVEPAEEEEKKVVVEAKKSYTETHLAIMKTLPCRAFSRGEMCKYGVRCRYKH